MKFLHTLFLSTIVHLAIGQLTYTSNQHYSTGSEIQYEFTNLVDPSLDFVVTGEDIFWDYSSVQTESGDTVQFINPAAGGYQPAFCLSNFYLFDCQEKFDEITNLAVLSAESIGFGNLSGQNIVRHFKVTEESFSETMIGATVIADGITVPAAFDYEDPDEILQFPLEYGNRDTSTFRLDIDLRPVGFDLRVTRTGQRINVVEGYGSLSTPAGTYNEVLKVRTIIQSIDTTVLNGAPLVFNSTFVDYKWYAKGFSGPVMQASGAIVEGVEGISEVRFQSEAEVSNVNSPMVSPEIEIYPNPFASKITIDGGSETIRSIQIFDALGQQVFRSSKRAQQLDLQLDLEPGTYWIKIQNEGNRPTLQKIIRQ